VYLITTPLDDYWSSESNLDLNKYQYHIFNNIAEYFEGNSDLYCDGKSALKTAQILDQIQQKID